MPRIFTGDPIEYSSRGTATDEQWESHKEEIGNLYVNEGCTAAEVRDLMINRHGFHATQRMYKSRFKDWGMASKNTKAIEYEAMKMVYDDKLAREGVQVSFRTLRGTITRIYRIADIRKELARPGSRRRSEQNRESIVRQGVDKILERQNFQLVQPEQPLMSEQDANSRIVMESPPTSSEFDSDQDQDVSTAEEHAAMIPNFPGVIASYFSQAYTPSANSQQVPDFDLDGALRAIPADHLQLTQEPQSSRVPGFFALPPKGVRDTELWALHLFETAIKTDEKRPDDFAGSQRQCACMVFERMLANANPHILLSLIHIFCVFCGLGGEDNYQVILSDCQDSILKKLENGQSFAIPFRYALACESKDQSAISEFGQQLLNGTEQNGLDNRRWSSNLLVCRQFGAHYLLEHRQDPAGARDILLDCLHNSVRCLKGNHAVNVNCLYLLARAFQKLGQFHAAMDAYSDAAQRSVEVFGRKHPYRMILVRVLAFLQADLGMTREAEQSYLEVFWCRNEMLGPGHSYTYSSAQELQRFWISQGQHEAAVQQETLREELYHDDKHWKVLSEREAKPIRNQRRNVGPGMYWEKPGGLFKYEFVMPREAYMRVGPPSTTAYARL